jgi:hypothetical protein
MVSRELEGLSVKLNVVLFLIQSLSIGYFCAQILICCL